MPDWLTLLILITGSGALGAIAMALVAHAKQQDQAAGRDD